MNCDEQDIFDVASISDLPDEMRKEIEARRLDDFEVKIMELFKIANRALSIDEVMVAFYRKYHILKNRRQILNKLYQIAKTGNSDLIMVKRGIYELKRKEDKNVQIEANQ